MRKIAEAVDRGLHYIIEEYLTEVVWAVLILLSVSFVVKTLVGEHIVNRVLTGTTLCSYKLASVSFSLVSYVIADVLQRISTVVATVDELENSCIDVEFIHLKRPPHYRYECL